MKKQKSNVVSLSAYRAARKRGANKASKKRAPSRGTCKEIELSLEDGSKQRFALLTPSQIHDLVCWLPAPKKDFLLIEPVPGSALGLALDKKGVVALASELRSIYDSMV